VRLAVELDEGPDGFLPGKILPRKFQKEDAVARGCGVGRWFKLSANAISTCRAIKRAV